jgi:hypothetical protein
MCAMYRTSIYIDALLKASSASVMETATAITITPDGGGGGDTATGTRTPSPREEEVRAFVVPRRAPMTARAISQKNTLARLHLTAQPFVREMAAYSHASVLVGTDDDENASPRNDRHQHRATSTDDKLDEYEATASDGDVEYFERARKAKPPAAAAASRPKKKESSRSKTLAKENGRKTLPKGGTGAAATTRSDSAVRSSLDDSRPGYGGIDGMYKGGGAGVKDDNKNN